MILFHILSTKQPFFSPKVSVSGMLIPLYEQKCRRNDALSLDKLSGGCHGFVLPAFDTELRHMFENPASLLATAALALTSPCQLRYLPFRRTSVVLATKRKLVYRLHPKISTFFNLLIHPVRIDTENQCLLGFPKSKKADMPMDWHIQAAYSEQSLFV
jgi:hypothetical protein